MKDHTVAIAHTFDVGGKVQADGPVADSIHGLGIEEVMGPRWRGEGQSQMRAESNKHNTRVPTVALIYKNSMAFPSRSVTNHNYVRIVS